jgi:hypothetical protein
MSVVNDTVTLYVGRQTADERPAYTRAAGDFVVSLNGVLKTIGNFTEIGNPTGSKWCDYSFTVGLDSAIGLKAIRVEPTDNTLSTDVIAVWYGGEIENYDNDMLASLLLTQQGIPAVTSAADNSLGDIVDGDSYKSATLTMPAAKLTPFSISDISAAGITVEAAIMGAPGGTSYPITAAVVSGTGLSFTISWDTQLHPGLTTTSSATWYIDVQVIKTGPPKQIITTNRYSFNQVWQRDTRTT